MLESTAPLQARGLPGFGQSTTTHVHCGDRLPVRSLRPCPISLLPVNADGGELLPDLLVDRQGSWLLVTQFVDPLHFVVLEHDTQVVSSGLNAGRDRATCWQSGCTGVHQAVLPLMHQSWGNSSAWGEKLLVPQVLRAAPKA